MSPTGEQPKAETPLGENTNIKLGLVVTIVIAAMSVGGLYYKVDAQAARIEKTEATASALQAQVAALQLANAVQVTKFDSLTTAVNGLTAEVKKLIEDFRGGTRAVNYRAPRGPSP